MTELIFTPMSLYTDDNRIKLNTFEDFNELAGYLNKQNTVDKFATFADHNGLKRRNLMIKKSHSLLERFINSRIIYNIMDDEAWTMYLNKYDPAINATLKVFRTNSAFPKKPDKAQTKKK